LKLLAVFPLPCDLYGEWEWPTSAFIDAGVMFRKEEPRGTVASQTWPFLLRGIRLEALNCRCRMPEKRNTVKLTNVVDNPKIAG
jgi:hypothetical protein